MLYLINLKVGKPTAAVILLTCLFFPSVSVSDSHEVGMFFLNLIGGILAGTDGSFIIMLALDVCVRCSLPSIEIVTPCCKASTAFADISPSTCTQ